MKIYLHFIFLEEKFISYFTLKVSILLKKSDQKEANQVYRKKDFTRSCSFIGNLNVLEVRYK